MSSIPVRSGFVWRIVHSRTSGLITTHFAPLLFAGMMITGIVQDIWDLEAMYAQSPAPVVAIFMGIGLALGAAAHHISHRLAAHDTKSAWIIAGVGFAGGTLPVGLVLSAWILQAITVFTVLVVVLRVAHFLRTVATLIAPNRYPTWPQVGMMLYTYLSMLTAFTLINLAMDLLHTLHPSVTPAFNFITAGGSPLVNAFYFSVVVMTTLGFGDITPLTSLAKISVALQCLTSYVMFALLVGVAMRGVLSNEDE
ncbi:hypothetical protein DPQ33_13610 [Oceanidesulfovibrio indonesiensis]|uniref:Potassium channel domain-containing protein n=1 Tax=Oceanidesulfovibrio indonesiensis TaxID=54767 RepID=A0A7M3MCC0_9BACT|nr:ion channel [Oceanidesulfovibrio indonesiensis]TVM15996.1 hypothetical protein DPQ33_13610 [Oceanidesulfovibrio indonesiensis]